MDLRAAHPESPVHLSLVRAMLDDASVPLAPRRIDTRWRSARIVDVSVAGFNPFLGRVFYADASPLARWLADPSQSARGLNAFDGLINDLLFAVHDWVHVWSTRLLATIAPTLGFGTRPITSDNFDDYVFCQLITETAATVAVDYWYLCTFDINDVVPIGTTRTGGLTTPYQQRHAAEYQRFNPALDVQRPEFFAELCALYCSGEFDGFDADDVRNSPLLAAWMTKELRYGDRQRAITRDWFAYLADDDVEVDDPSAPVDASSPERRAIIEAVGDAVWRGVQRGELDRVPRLPPPPHRTQRRPVDFRFANANALDDGAALAPPASPCREQLEYWMAQRVSRHDYDDFDAGERRRVAAAVRARDPLALSAAVDGHALVPETAGEPADLLLVN